MIERKYCSNGSMVEVAPDAGVWKYEQPLDRSWGTPVLSCCRWIRREAYACSLETIDVLMRKEDKHPTSLSVDMSQCRYHKGECEVKATKERVDWVVDYTWKEEALPAYVISGILRGDTFLSQDGALALTYPAPPDNTIVTQNGTRLNKTMQGLFSRTLNVTQQRLGRNVQDHLYGLYQTDEGRQSARESIQKNELAGRLQALFQVLEAEVARAFSTSARAICETNAQVAANFRSLLLVAPSMPCRGPSLTPSLRTCSGFDGGASVMTMVAVSQRPGAGLPVSLVSPVKMRAASPKLCCGAGGRRPSKYCSWR